MDELLATYAVNLVHELTQLRVPYVMLLLGRPRFWLGHTSSIFLVKVCTFAVEVYTST